MSGSAPLVSVITPVYNGEGYLAECIDSILRQTYRNWEYVIVNNRSTDRTREIIAHYAALDPRIRHHDNVDFVGVIDNHNIAFGKIDPGSNYCKLVQADDWLFPECIERMVAAGEAAPSAGVIGSYCLAGTRVRCDGLPYTTTLISGKELSRLTLLGAMYLFWSPSCLMIRSELIRRHERFYASPYLHADVEALYELLQTYDFAFVHQILSYIRTHEQSMTAQDAKRANTQKLSHLHLLRKFGPVFLSEQERKAREETLLADYYQSLAMAAFDGRTADFWDYQRAELTKLGSPLDRMRLVGTIAANLAFRPRDVARHLKWRLLQRPDA